jgi:sugar/nucleoside kinase (ribokinase family)
LSKIVGTGLICLDAVASQKHVYKVFAGGSCLNVFVILNTLGWQVYPVGMIGRDTPASFILQDLLHWNVDTSFIFQNPRSTTPVYVQTITEQGHSFSSQCPFTGNYFPKYKVLEPEYALQAWQRLPKNVDVFYIERVSLLALTWAQEYRRNGALIYFEPNRIDDESLFAEIAAHSHVVKYSRERRSAIQNITDPLPIPLEIETLGSAGSHFRVFRNTSKSGWLHIPPAQVDSFRDACGAGDWLSAMFIHGYIKAKQQQREDPDFLRTLLTQSQTWSAKNCASEGARGMMYQEHEIIRTANFSPFSAVHKNE